MWRLQVCTISVHGKNLANVVHAPLCAQQLCQAYAWQECSKVANMCLVLQVWQGESFEAEGEMQAYNVVANGEHALSFALAWLDLPGEPGIFPVLTNDLDMKVRMCFGPQLTLPCKLLCVSEQLEQ